MALPLNVYHNYEAALRCTSSDNHVAVVVRILTLFSLFGMKQMTVNFHFNDIIRLTPNISSSLFKAKLLPCHEIRAQKE